MAGAVAGTELASRYRGYAALLDAVGHDVNLSALSDYLAEGGEARGDVEAVLAGRARGRRVPAEAVERMERLSATLAEDVASALGDASAHRNGLARFLRDLPEERKDAVADVLVMNGQRRFLRERHVRLNDVRRVLSERSEKGRFALVKLVPYLRDELRKRGLEVSDGEVRGWFEPDAADRDVPFSLCPILRGVNGEFRNGLIPLGEMVGDRDPDEWLEEVRLRLQFRSHSAMHKAIADATGLKYDCVHKALSGRKARRIQAEIKHCLETWLKERDSGCEPSVGTEHRGVPLQSMLDLLPALEERFATKEDLYRTVSKRTAIKTGSIRRYFQANGQLRYAPIEVYQCACDLASAPLSAHPQGSYLSDERTRRVAEDLAQRANDALARMQETGDYEELAVLFHELRRALIVTMKESRLSEPALT